MVSIYPPGTREHLRALCAFHTQEREIAVVAWRLWWAGYPVPLHYARAVLEQAAALWEDFPAELVAHSGVASEDAGASEVDREAFEAAMAAVIEQAPDAPLHRPLIRTMRHRLHRAGFPTLMRVALEVGLGRFTGYSVDAVTGEVDREEQRIVEAGLGLHHGSAAALMLAHPEIGAALEQAYVTLSQLFATAQPRQVLTATTDAELLQARDQLRMLQQGLDDFITVVEQLFGRGFAGLDATLQALREMRPIDQALLLLLWRQVGPEALERFMRSEVETLERLLQQLLRRATGPATLRDASVPYTPDAPGATDTTRTTQENTSEA